MRGRHSILLVVSLTLLGLVVTSAGVRAQSGGVPVDSFQPKQVPRGGATTFIVEGKKLKEVQAVEVTPPEGVTVIELKKPEEVPISKATLPDGKAVIEVKKKVKNTWTFVLVVAADAEPGERTLVLLTKKGRSEPQKILIPPHIPRISDLTILGTRATGAEVEFTLSVSDEAGDLGSQPWVTSELFCGTNSLEIGGRADELVQTNAENARLRHRSTTAIFAGVGGVATVTGTCVLQVWVKDEKEYESNRLTAVVNFPPGT